LQRAAGQPASLDGFFNAKGLSIAGVPEWVYGLSAVYERPLTPDLRGFFQANWNWQSDVNYAISGDPGTIQKAYGLLGGRVGVSAPDKAWSVALYASNLLDKRYAAQITPSPVTGLNPGRLRPVFQPGLGAPGRCQPRRRLLTPLARRPCNRRLGTRRPRRRERRGR
jgi:iron complex outermembrane receptor protein